MQIVLIGSGNVATALGNLCQRAGHTILQVYGRNQLTSGRLADTLGAAAVNDWAEITRQADIYLVALPDSFIPGLNQFFLLSQGLALHTAGAVPMHSLAGVAPNFGVLYPLQSLRAGEKPPELIPLLVDGNSPHDKEQVLAFAQTLSPQVAFANDEQRLNLHLAAVWANNFTNYLLTEAWEICREKRVDFKLLLPLINHTVQRLDTYAPADMQTGPAIRGDFPTMERHLHLLANRPISSEIYRLLSEAISNYYRQPKGQK